MYFRIDPKKLRISKKKKEQFIRQNIYFGDRELSLLNPEKKTKKKIRIFKKFFKFKKINALK